MENTLIDLFGWFSIKGAKYVLGLIRLGCDEPVVPQGMVNILLVGLYTSVQVPDYSIGYCIMTDSSIG